MELLLHSQINIFSWGYLTERLPVFRLFLINSYQSGILLKIKRKLKLNMYLDVRFYLKCLPFFFYLFGGSHQRFSVEVSVLGGFMGFVRELLCWGLFFNKVAGLWPVAIEGEALARVVIPLGFARFLGTSFLQSTSWMAASDCFICDILKMYKLRKNILLDIILYITCI